MALTKIAVIERLLQTGIEKPQGFPMILKLCFLSSPPFNLHFTGQKNKAFKILSGNVARTATICMLCFLRLLRFNSYCSGQGKASKHAHTVPKADKISGDVIGAAIEVHRIMGPGLLESIYEKCLLRELE